MDQQPASGQKYLTDLSAAGFTQDEIDQEKSKQSQDMSKAGFTDNEVGEYWGKRQLDMSPVKDIVKANIDKAKDGEASEASTKPKREPIDVSPKPIEAKDMWDTIAAAWGHSASGLLVDQEKPPVELPPNATRLQSLTYNVANMVADAPEAALGFVAGGKIAGRQGALFGMGFVPAAMRKFLMDKYSNNEFQDSGDAARNVVSSTWQELKDAGWEGTKAGIASMAMGNVGDNLRVMNAMGDLGKIGTALTSTPAQLAAENATMATVSAALEGRLPSWDEFERGTIAMLGFHALSAGFGGAISAKEKLQNIYAKTGATPSDMSPIINSDPVIKQEIASDNPGLPKEAEVAKETPAPAAPKEAPEPKTDAERQGVKEGYELPQEARDKVLSSIGKDPEETKESFMQKAKDGALDLYVNTFDKTARLKQALENMPSNLAESSYGLARSFADVNSKIDQVIKHGPLDPETNDHTDIKGLDNILGRVVKETGDTKLDNLKAFMISARRLELEKRGIEQAGDSAGHQEIFDSGKGTYGKYMKEIVAFQNGNLRYAEGKDLLSEGQRKAMEKSEFYIPLHKIVEADSASGGSSSALFKKIGDSLLDIKDPIDSIYKNTEILIRAADRNELVKKASEDLAEEAEDITPRTKKTKVSSDDIGKALGDQGYDVDPDALDGFNVFRKEKVLTGEGVVTFRDNGKLVAKRFDPAVADVLNSYSESPAAMGIFTRMFRTAAQALRFGTIQNPATGFFARHAIRNQQQAAIFSTTGKSFWGAFMEEDTRFGMKVAEGVGDALGIVDKEDPTWRQFVRDGGAVSSMEKIPQAYYTDTLERMDKKLPFKDHAWNILDNTLSFSHAFIMANDNGIRFNEYKRSLDQGDSRLQATFNSRNVLADFQKEGLKRSFLQSTTAFFKAHYQGEFQMAGALADPATRYQALAKNIGYLTVPSIMLGLAQADDKRIDSLPDWVKWNYWNVHIPHWRDARMDEARSQRDAYPDEVRQKADGSYQVNDGYVFRIPKPFANGMLFGSSFEEMLRDYRKKDPEHFAKFLGNVAEKMVANPVPTALEPVLEQMTNRNFFGGKPLIRAEMERNHVPEMQYTPYTSEAAKWIGKQISSVPLIRDIGPGDAKLASPMVIENYLNAYTGGSAKYILQTADKLMGKPGGVQDKQWTWADAPLVREFTVRHDIEPQTVNDFMDSQNLAQQVQGSIKDMQKRGDYKGVVELQNKYGSDGIKVGKYQEQIMNMMQMVHKLDRANIDPVQKRQLSDGYNYMIISTAKHGQEILDNMREVMKNKPGSK